MILVSSQNSLAQSYVLKGTVVNNKIEPIPFINVRVKTLQRGARTNNLGQFSISLPVGRHELVLSGVGHKALQSIVIVTNKNVEKQFLLETANTEIKKVVISANKKDASKEIIRKLIKHKKELQQSAESYSHEVYIKATADYSKDEKRKQLKKKKRKNKKIPKKDSSAAKSKPITKQFAEVYLEVTRSYPDKIKEKRTGVNIKGDKKNFFYLSTTAGDFNFYKNLIRIKNLGKVSFLSPFSTSGLAVYRYKYKEFLHKNGHMYHRIQFRPSRTSNALLRGEVLIQDKTWAIKEINASFPNHQTPEYKKFEIGAVYEYIENKVWLPKTYNINYKTHNKMYGQTDVVFSQYKLDTVFAKKHFSNELSATSIEAYERDSTFWEKTRPIPLSKEEIKIIHYRDSVYEATHSEQYRDSTEKENNKITINNVLWSGQNIENWRKEKYVTLPALVNIFQPLRIGGMRYSAWLTYRKKFKSKKQLNLSSDISYGPVNKDIRGYVNAFYLFNPFTRSSLQFSAGRSVSNLFFGDAIINQLSRSNYYLNESFSVKVRRELINGLYISNKLELGFRKSLHDIKLNSFIDSVLEREVERPINFENYAAFFNEFRVSYTPEQKYIREPYEKVILGSRFPTFYGLWRKGITGIFNSIISYDRIEIGAIQEINMGTLGLSTYNIKYGNFLRRGNVEAPDYKYIARDNPGLLLNPLTSFQSMDSTFTLFKGFVEAHHRHDFNGALLTKIPYMKKLKLFESAGAGFLIAPERKLRYIEAFAGLEKQFTLFRQPIRIGVWGVASYANQFKKQVQLKFSLRTYNFRRDRWD